jgi:DNA-binding response OmpR family regulator
MAVLIVDDDERSRRSLGAVLADAGFGVEVAEGDAEALGLLKQRRFQIVLLGGSGRAASLDVLAAFRQRDSATPVILLSAHDSLEARLKAFAGGVDDYLPKPFHYEELLARMRSVLKRTALNTGYSLQCADLTLDAMSRQVYRAGRAIRLTRREFDLLHHLMEHRGRVQSRELLLQNVWEKGEEATSNVVEVYIRHLRQKVDAPFERPLIRTVRGIGYMVMDV